MKFLPRKSHRFFGHLYFTEARLLALDKILSDAVAPHSQGKPGVKEMILHLKDDHEAEIDSFEEAMADSRMHAHWVTGFSVKILIDKAGLALDVNEKYPCWIYFSTTEPDYKAISILVTRLTLWSKEIVGYNLIMLMRILSLAVMCAGGIVLFYNFFFAHAYTLNFICWVYLIYGTAITIMPIRWFAVGKGRTIMPVVAAYPKFVGITLPLFLIAPWIDHFRTVIFGKP